MSFARLMMPLLAASVLAGASPRPARRRPRSLVPPSPAAEVRKASVVKHAGGFNVYAYDVEADDAAKAKRARKAAKRLGAAQ